MKARDALEDLTQYIPFPLVLSAYQILLIIYLFIPIHSSLYILHKSRNILFYFALNKDC